MTKNRPQEIEKAAGYMKKYDASSVVVTYSNGALFGVFYLKDFEDEYREGTKDGRQAK